MRRREFIAELSLAAVLTLVSGAVVTFSPVARAQQSPVVHRVGYLGSTQIPYLIEALHSGLRKLGYVEGKNLKVEYRFGGSGPESLDVLAAELVAFGPDAIITLGTPAALAAKRCARSNALLPTQWDARWCLSARGIQLLEIELPCSVERRCHRHHDRVLRAMPHPNGRVGPRAHPRRRGPDRCRRHGLPA